MTAKTAEDRYQSASGLKADLRACLDQLKKNLKIEVFEIGQNDILDKFQIPHKLYGRQKEIETILSAFDRVSWGSKESILVAGHQGIGKSALVKEIQKLIIQKRVFQ